MRFNKTGIYYTDTRILHCENNILSEYEFNTIITKVIEDNLDKIKAIITELVESVILDEKD